MFGRSMFGLSKSKKNIQVESCHVGGWQANKKARGNIIMVFLSGGRDLKKRKLPRHPSLFFQPHCSVFLFCFVFSNPLSGKMQLPPFLFLFLFLLCCPSLTLSKSFLKTAPEILYMNDFSEPFVVALEWECKDPGSSDYVQTCTGTLLSNKTVLTANCFVNDCSDIFAVALIGANRSNPVEIIEVGRIVVHEDFQFDVMNWKNDIALWFLKQEVVSVKKFGLLPTTDLFTDSVVFAAGLFCFFSLCSSPLPESNMVPLTPYHLKP